MAACAVGSFTALSAQAAAGRAPTPPMGWNDWARYQCNFTARTILDNAEALVKTGLAARGYNTVTIDDCWMTKDRDAQGNLQADPQRFPHGMKPVAAAIHGLGLKFGIYEDAGYLTCARFAGSGAPKGGGKDHFLADARLFASWGVDYLKLDGCNVYVPKGQTVSQAYRVAYKAERDALLRVDRPIVFSASAPAFFAGNPHWYDVLTWVRGYGQLWRDGDDMDSYHAEDPDHPRFAGVLWNYTYNLPLGRFQKPGNFNDADFIIGGDPGLSLAETRSQLALWSMMAAPLILSSDVERLAPESLAVLGNKDVIAVDQDALGREANLLRRSRELDVLIKPLSSGAYAVAAFNHGSAATAVDLHPADLGFAGSRCTLKTRDLWTGSTAPASTSVSAQLAAHDTAIWKVTPAAGCGTALRQGAITRIIPEGPEATHTPEEYTRCLSAARAGSASKCSGKPGELWQVLSDGRLRSGEQCLQACGYQVQMSACGSGASQRWRYDILGRLISRENQLCLTGGADGGLSLARCEHNPASQIWSLPQPLTAE